MSDLGMGGRKSREDAANLDPELVAFIVHATDPDEDHETPGWCPGDEWCAGLTFHQRKRAEAFIRSAAPVEPSE